MMKLTKYSPMVTHFHRHYFMKGYNGGVQISNLWSLSVNHFTKYPLSTTKIINRSLHNNCFKLQVPKHFNLITNVLKPLLSTQGDHTALWFTDGTTDNQLSYKQLYDSAVNFGSSLSKPDPPKCALVILPKVPEWWIANVGASYCGTVISPGTTMLTKKDIAHRLEKSGADCVICDEEVASRVDDITKHIDRKIVVGKTSNLSDGWTSFEELIQDDSVLPKSECRNSLSCDVTQLFFTSGTTGQPKMVPHTQASYGIGHQITSKLWLDLKKDDVIWNISDTGWAKAAWSSLYTPLLVGATAYIHQMTKFDVNEVLSALSRQPVTVLCAPPTAYRSFVQSDLQNIKLKALRHCVSAGEPLNPEVIEAWKKFTGLDIYEGFGQSETTLLCGTFKGMTQKPGSMGKPAPGYTIKIIDDNQNEVGYNEEGIIAVDLEDGWPVGLFKGYYNDPEASKKAFIGHYYLTGDHGYLDQDGYIWFVGRSDDVIISSGYRIGPFEVESALLEHEAVAESAVVASPDPLRGEVVKAFIVLSTDYQHHPDKESLAKQIQDYVKTITAPYKYPRKVEFVPNLPKTVSGKIRRIELKEREKNK